MSNRNSIKPGPRRKPLSQRFWQKVHKRGVDDCWLWAGSTNNKSYGKITEGGDNGKLLLAHRVSWEFAHGLIPDSLCVLHSCDNPLCVNPKHLFLGTKHDNTLDAVKKGRIAKGKRSGAYTHPERRTYGMRNGAYTHPERVPRGSYHPHAKLDEKAVREIRKLWTAGLHTQPQLGRIYGVNHATISAVVVRKSWRHVT